MKKRYKILVGFVLVMVILVILFKIRIAIHPPEIKDVSVLDKTRTTISNNLYMLDDSWLKKNNYGVWELYLQGKDFDLGVKNGILTEELAIYQEEAFVEQIRELIPSDFYLRFLKYFIAWFNKDICDYIPLEYQREIYGVSLNASKEFEFIAPNYHRIINYHAAHDIGHALNNMNLSACTAFGVKNSRSEDGGLLVGRNMDFYMGDKFSKNKIVAFCKPENGYSFTYITWAGLIGVISGMNNQGLTVTLNSAKSSIPSSTKMPVSILAREILQYASTIDEALSIAQGNETFVAESFLISSAKDRDFAVIEKSTDTTVLYRENDDELILTNHFQSEAFANRELTQINKETTETVYRWKRVEELLNSEQEHNVKSFSNILRDQKGVQEETLGYGNEMAINQLIAHHSVIFKPEQLTMWVSVGPYQLGKYIAYDLNTIFADTLDIKDNIYNEGLTIAEDTFLYSKSYKNFVLYKQRTKELLNAINQDSTDYLTEEDLHSYQQLNPEYFYTFSVIGDCYNEMGNVEMAEKFYLKALEKKIAKKTEEDNIKQKLVQLREEER